MKRIFDYLDLRDVGFLEFLIAFYPIVGEYSILGIPCSILYLLIICTIAYNRPKIGYNFKQLIPLLIFVGGHDFLWMILFGSLSNFHILISIIFAIFATYFIAPRINFKKLNGSLNWVALLSIGGLLYHVLLISQGTLIQPISLPFIPEQPLDSRFFEEGMRPVSFFVEPSSYASFMLFPLLYSLINKKYIWAIIIIFTELLSTSSNGIIFSGILVLSFMLITNISLSKKLMLSIIILSFGFLLLKTNMFEASTTKMEETEYTEYSRVINGPQMCMHVSKLDLVLGVPSTNLFSYYKAGGFNDAKLDTGRFGDNLFVPTLWNMLLKYGIVGLVLFLNVYFYFYKRDKMLRPFVIMLLISFCVQSTLFNPGYIVQILVLYALYNYRRNEQQA